VAELLKECLQQFSHLWVTMRVSKSLVRTTSALVLCTGASVLSATRPQIENTAVLSFMLGTSPQTVPSNTVSLQPLPTPAPAQVTFWRVAQGVAAAQPTPIDGGQCFGGNGGMSSLSFTPTGQSAQNFTGSNAPIIQTGSFRAGEPVVVNLKDDNRNRDPQARETIDLEITTSNGDREKLQLLETGQDTAIFTAVIPSTVSPPAPVARDCRLSVAQGVVLHAKYIDSFFPTDIAEAEVLVDPFGTIFNSSSGDPVSGVKISVINTQTGQPATVYGDDQVSIYPSTLVSGETAVDSNGNQYTFAPGQYRFPYLAPGQYRFVITPPEAYIAPSNIDRATLLTIRDPAGSPYTITNGSFADNFSLNGPEPVKIDVPIDPVPGALVLQKFASVSTASAGDFIQYQVTLQNRNKASAIRSAVITDILPPSMRYRAGTLRIDGKAEANPSIADNGRTLSIPVSRLGAGASTTISYITQVISGVPAAEAVNRAIARVGRTEQSNEARAIVRINQPFFSDRFTIVGRVVEDQGQCSTPVKSLTGISNIRVLMEDGTYVSTDSDGQFHFEAVKPGTHVVQLDLASLPGDLEAAPCIRNTRFARNSFSQFVEARGGALWRTDFYLRRKKSDAGKVSLQLSRRSVQSDNAEYTVKFVNQTGYPLANIRVFVRLPEGTQPKKLLPTQEFANDVVTLPLDLQKLQQNNSVTLTADESGLLCKAGETTAKAFALFDRGPRKSMRTPTVEIALSCKDKATSQTSSVGNVDVPEDRAVAPVKTTLVHDDATAAGASTDWLANQAAGTEVLFPPADHNPRAPAVRVVLKHAPDQSVTLRVNGTEADGLAFDGTDSDPTRGIAIAKWRSVPLHDGANTLVADIFDKSGAKVTSLTRTVYYSNLATRAELIAERSHLSADGITQPLIAVRFTDRFGKPVRKGVSGAFELESPYTSAQSVDDKNRRQLEGRDRFDNTFQVSGDDGVALIALEPTTQTGTATLHFKLGDERARTRQTLRAWLAPQSRDWIVVGFAKGTGGFNTLKGKAENLPDARDADNAYSDGQISLYAKGRIKGKWLLTVAYDSDKKRGRTASERDLLRTIDPNRYYTLYGDQTQQGYDAASLEKVYVKLERNQFYAMFGDYETGLNQNQLSRYSRSLNGAKTEYRGKHLVVNAFAARTLFNFARDEIQGTGLSTFYRLSKSNIILNSDKISIETRDRFRSEKIVETKSLSRHIDYDIDYDAGTLTFREPIRTRDSDFNPVFIVADYEVLGAAGHDTNAGGRVGGEWADGKVQVGATMLHDEGFSNKSNLGGVDLKARLGENTEVRLEAARTHSENAQRIDNNGDAYLAEIEHRSERIDALAYYRRQDGGFGFGQQNGGESGTEKFGIDGRVRIADNWQLAGSSYRENYLSTGSERTVAQSRLEYVTPDNGLFAGLQLADDRISGQSRLTSKLVTLGANQYFLNRKLEVQAQSDFSLGGGSDSLDFPTRYRIGGTYALTEGVRVLLNHEITNGRQLDSSTTRLGFDVRPWKGGRVSSTLNQARISEYGPRTYAQFGLTQSLLLGDRWSVDAGLDTSHTFNKKVSPTTALNLNQPLASGGVLGNGSLTDDYYSVSTGATYRTDIWSWNSRLEWRHGQQSNRYGLTSNVLRQTQKGVAVSGFGQYLRTTRAAGQKGTLATVGAALAYRPLGSHWAVLQKLEFRSDVLTNGVGGAGSGLFGFNSLQGAGDIKNQRIVNNLSINSVSRAWSEEDHSGNAVDLNQRTQFSVYYGSKYTFDTFDTAKLSGYTHLIGAEVRHDVTSVLDIGLQASILHNWNSRTIEYSFGPQAGISPFKNGWVTFGYNIRGFKDKDFADASYTQSGPYVTLRLKFDQQSLGLNKK
jgi:uncharacterized repeat protein (TIGR01451 family)